MKIPFEDAPIHVFQRVKDFSGGGAMFIARFYPYNDFPIFFSGQTKDEVAESARNWRDEQVAKAEGNKLRMKRAQAARHKK